MSVFVNVSFKINLTTIMLRFDCGQQERTTWLLYCPSLCWVGGENGKKKAKLVGWEKGSLTEAISNNNTDKKNIQNKPWNAQSNSHCPMPSALLNSD